MDSDDDISDEHQDWSIIDGLQADTQSLPKRGEKDFEPDGTGTQSSTLAGSRSAMYSALQRKRVHGIRNHVSAEWIPRVGKAKVLFQRGTQFYTMGKADSHGDIWLQPEEILYLVERGTMSLYYQTMIPLSLQATYALTVRDSRDLERYQVYSTLRVSGFAVMSAPESNPDYVVEEEPHVPLKTPLSISTVITRLGINLFETIYYCYLVRGHDINFRSYPQVYKHIAYPENKYKAVEPEQPEFPYRVEFNIWKPGSQFKKSNPRSPDYRMAIVSARDFSIPTFQQTASMFMSASVNHQASPTTGSKYLKEGWRSLIIAVVDCGVISFFKMSDVSFVQQKLYLNTFKGNKRSKARRK